jgi:branched-chain amino acid transport system permease protein
VSSPLPLAPTSPSGRPRVLYVKLATFAVLALLPGLLLSDSRYFATIVLVAIFATVAVSLDMLLGFAGQLALGQTALFGVGAYTWAVLTTRHDVSSELALLCAVAAAFVIALLTSPILRLRGFYFALATLALVLVAHEVFVNWIAVTGGASGLVGIGAFSFFGLEVTSQSQSYLFAYVVLLIGVVAAVHMRHSRFGRSLVAIREDETAAEALGIDVFQAKIRVWLIAAMLAGLAGVVYASYLRFLSPAQFGLEPTIYLLAAIVIGGTGSVYGAVIGVAVVWMLPELLSGFEKYAVLALGIAVIVLVILAPDGLAGRLGHLFGAISARLRRSRGRMAAGPPSPGEAR